MGDPVTFEKPRFHVEEEAGASLEADFVDTVVGFYPTGRWTMHDASRLGSFAPEISLRSFVLSNLLFVCS